MYDQKRIEKLEQALKENPKKYQAKVTLLAWLGNLYIAFGVIVLLILLVLACLSILVLKAFAIKIIIPVAIFLYVIVRSLWVSVDKPQGIEIFQQDAPELFQIIHRLREQLNSPHFHHVLITEEFNAAVVQRPRLGILGHDENYLIIGLPLMQSLSTEQLTSVLAHEFGHLSKNHARAANWIYRQRIRWSQLYMLVEQNASRIDIIFHPFFKRFVPYFAAYSFPIARANEYEADRISVELTSAETVAETLSTVNIVGCYLNEEFWPTIFKHAEEMPKPNVSPYLGYVQRLTDFAQNDKTQLWLNQSLSLKTNFEDTHPSLQDRLDAIGQPAKVAWVSNEAKSDRLLGSRLIEITQIFDQKWQSDVLESWQNHYQNIQKQKEYLDELNQKIEQNVILTEDEKIDHIDLTERIAHDPERAFQLCEVLYQQDSDNARVNFIYGQFLIERKNDLGCEILERAAELNEFYQVKVYETLQQFYLSQQNSTLADKYQQLLLDRVELEQNAMQEREQVTARDQFIPHALTDIELEALLSQLKAYSNIKKVYLVRKQTQYLAHVPCYVLGFSLKQGFGKVDEDAIVQTMRVLHENVTFAGETFLLSFDLAQTKQMKNKILKVQNSQLI